MVRGRTLNILVFGIHPAEFAKVGLVSLSSMMDDTISWKGIRRTKAVNGNRSVWFDERWRLEGLLTLLQKI
ncbi:MAG: hypothetical protein KKG76_10820 [Euryarchaeota archaeon]|nr:hypothetical protein [Euryarchaeota archaeon]